MVFLTTLDSDPERHRLLTGGAEDSLLKLWDYPTPRKKMARKSHGVCQAFRARQQAAAKKQSPRRTAKH
jgi:hypothetical protein